MHNVFDFMQVENSFNHLLCVSFYFYFRQALPNCSWRPEFFTFLIVNGNLTIFSKLHNQIEFIFVIFIFYYFDHSYDVLMD